MRLSSLLICVAAGMAALATPTMLAAQTRVIASTPAQGASVSKPKLLTLTFSDALLPPTVAASIVMTAMPGVENHGEMVIRNFTTSWSDESKTLTLTLRQPLRAGSYDMRWQATATDGQRMKGQISFIVD